MNDANRARGRRAGCGVGALCLALLAACAVLPACSKVELTDVEHVQRAKDHQDKGDLRASVVELKSALQKNSDNPEARWLLGEIYLEVGEHAAAEKELRRAGELGIPRENLIVALGRALLGQQRYDAVLKEIETPGTMEAARRARLYALRGDAHFGRRELEQAGREFEQALAVDPRSAEARIGQARIAMWTGKWGEARERLDQALTVDSDAPEAWLLLGNLEAARGHAKEAEEAYGKAIEHSFVNVSARLQRALLRIDQEDFAGAKQDIAAVKAAAARYPRIPFVEGVLYFRQRQYAEAQQSLEKAVNTAPDYLPALFYLGVSHYAQRHLQQAETYLGHVVAAEPGQMAARSLLGAARMRLGDTAGAEKMLVPVLDRDPDDVLALRLLGYLYLSQGKVDKGIAHLERAIALDPKQTQTRLRFGLSLLAAGEKEHGLQTLEDTVEVAPAEENAAAVLVLGLLIAGEYDQAIATAERLRAERPEDPLPHTMLGVVHLRKGDEAAARAAFEGALKASPGDPGASLNLAALAARAGDGAKARAIYQEALKHHPGHLQTLLQLAELEMRAGQVEQAKKWLKLAEEKNPDAPEPKLFLAGYYLDQGQPAQALTALTPLQSALPDQPAVLILAGEIQLALDQPASAAQAFERLVKVEPESAQAHYLLGRAYIGLDQLDKARKSLESAVALAPNHLQANVALARLRMRSNDVVVANRILADLQKQYPEHPEVLGLAGWLAMHQSRPADAVAAFQKAAAKASTAQMTLDLALVQWQVKDWDGSVKTLEDWLDKHPGDAAVRYQLGIFYMLHNRPKPAQAAFAQVLAAAPDHAPALNNLAWLLRSEDSKRALGYAERANGLVADNPAFMDTLGMVLLERGEADRALRILREASRKAPEDASLRYHMVKALAQNGEKKQAREMLKVLLDEGKPFLEAWEAKALLKELEG